MLSTQQLHILSTRRSYEALNWLLPTAKRRFCDQGWEQHWYTHWSIGINAYDQKAVWQCLPLLQPNGIPSDYYQVFSARKQFPPVDYAPNLIREHTCTSAAQDQSSQLFQNGLERATCGFVSSWGAIDNWCLPQETASFFLEDVATGSLPIPMIAPLIGFDFSKRKIRKRTWGVVRINGGIQWGNVALVWI